MAYENIAIWAGLYGEYKIPPVVIREAKLLGPGEDMWFGKGEGFELLKLWGDAMDDVVLESAR